MRFNATIALMCVFLALHCGCNRVRPPKQPRLDPHAASQVHVASEQLRTNTAVGTPVVTRDDAGNLLHITLPIRSATNRTLQVDYRVTFFDRNGQSISKLGPFTKVLEANTPDTITVNSTSPRATDFQIDLRSAR